MKILVGVGPDAKLWAAQGWRCNDVQPFEGVDLHGPCWDLAVPDASVDEILAKGMLEHLTYHEVAKSLVEWRRVLKPGGHFTAEVPDIEEYIREYIKMYVKPETAGGEGRDAGAEGEPNDVEVCTGIERWLRRAIYGWQRWPGDEHRSGWTEKLYHHYLDKHFGGRHEIRRMAYSFEEDAPVSRVRHLWARAWKEQP